MIRCGIIGGAGFTGGELLRLLLHHPDVEVVFVQSVSQAGERVSAVHRDLADVTDITFVATASFDVDVLFLCLPHGKAKKFIDDVKPPSRILLIDLSRDHRIDPEKQGFVYGLPELNGERIARVQRDGFNIANPGCFATCIQLGLLPLAKEGALHANVHTTAITGSTGAGQSSEPTLHFSWRHANMQVYQPFTHPHLQEIRQSLVTLQPGFASTHFFLPFRGSFTRGIIATTYLPYDGSTSDASNLYRAFYQMHPFVSVVDHNPDLKSVVNTNRCFIFPAVHDGTLLVVSVLDNLLKGAAGQAVQNMNLAFDLEETRGLMLKANVY